MMKDFIISLILIAMLNLLFSTAPEDRLPSGGVGTQYPGDSGMVLPGGGADMAEVIVRKHVEERHESSVTSDEDKTESEIPAKTEMEVQKKMENMWLFFWYGVAAVLLGETVALMVAATWMRIYVRMKTKGGKE